MGVIVNQFCCGCPLQTGTQFIGWLSLISGLSGFISSATMMILISGVDKYGLIYILIPWVVISVIWVAISIPLLIAAWKNSKPNLLLPWLIISVLGILVVIGFGLYMTIALMLSPDPTLGIVSIVLILVGTALSIYFWLVIYSYYYQQMTEAIPLISEGKVYSTNKSTNDL